MVDVKNDVTVRLSPVMLNLHWFDMLPNHNTFTTNRQQIKPTRSHPEMVGDMSRVTLNFDLSKIPFVYF